MRRHLHPLPLQPPLVLQFLFDCLALGSIKAAATIGGAKLDAMQSTLAVKLTMRQAAELAAEMASW